MKTDIILGMIGLCGGLLCAAADILFDYKGSGNKRYGPGGIMDSNWDKMPMWRFKSSIWLAAIAVPMYLMGIVALYRQIAQSNATVGGVFGVCAVISSCGTLFIHATVCYIPMISKTLSAGNVSREIIGTTVETLYKSMLIPFVALWLLLVAGLSGIVIYAIMARILALPWWYILLTPLSLVVFGMLLRLCNKKVFADLPGICMPSIGLGLFGLMAAINAL